MAAVWADVIEGAQNVVAAADYNDIFADDLPGNVIVRPGDLAAVGDANPAIGEDALFLVLKRTAVGIKRAGMVRASCGLAQKLIGRVKSGLKLLM